MESTKIIISDLKGTICSYPTLEFTDNQLKNLISKFLPFGSTSGEFVSSPFGKKKTILSYVFKIKHLNNRDDLVSISIIINKKTDCELFKPALKEIIEQLENNNLLREDILKGNLENIFQGINEEKEIEIENISINLSKIFQEVKTQLIKPELQIRGSFF